MNTEVIKEKKKILEREIDRLNLEFITAVKRNEKYDVLMKMRQKVKTTESEYNSLQ